MTTQRLSELLEELADLITPVDAVDAAWDRAQRTRRRRRLAVVGGTAVAVAAVSVGIAAVDTPDVPSGPSVPDRSPVSSLSPDPNPTKSATPRVPEQPDTTYAGIDVYWGPTSEKEADLPRYEEASSLPRTIDLSAGAPAAGDIDRAVAVYAVFADESRALDRVVLLAPGGTSRSLDTSRLEPVRDEFGNAGSFLTTAGGLAPDGRHVLFAQNSSIELYEVATGTWTTIDVPDWQAEGALWLDVEMIGLAETGATFGVDGRPLGRADVSAVTGALREDSLVYGPAKTSAGGVAQTQRLAGPVRGVPAGGVSNPEAIGVRRGDRLSALSFPDLGRSKGCCPVAGWLDADTVAFESDSRVLAWRVGSHEVTRVAELVGRQPGESYVASWARLGG